MILPTKRIAIRNSLIVIGSKILNNLCEAKSVSQLWEEFKKRQFKGKNVTPFNFEWFILSLNFLYIIKAITINENGIIIKNDKENIQ